MRCHTSPAGYAKRTPPVRLGTERLAHAAACVGGSERMVGSRRGMVRRRIVTTLSAALARELGERVLAYVRAAQLRGRTVDPVTTLLAGARLPCARCGGCCFAALPARTHRPVRGLALHDSTERLALLPVTTLLASAR